MSESVEEDGEKREVGNVANLGIEGKNGVRVTYLMLLAQCQHHTVYYCMHTHLPHTSYQLLSFVN